MLSTIEKIKVILQRNGWSETDLAVKLGQSKQNVNNKLQRGNLKELDIRKIADAMGCEVSITFTTSTGDTI